MRKPAPPVRIEISRSAIRHNLRFLKDMIGEDVLYTSVVKGNAYGHGIEEYCTIALEEGVTTFCTYSSEEAYRVWQATGAQADIIVMGYKSHDALEWMIENKIQFFVFEESFLEDTIEVAKKLGKRAIVHLEMETGMNRTGLSIDRLDYYLALMKENKRFVEFKGICTHFAGAESISNYYRVKQQERRFKELVKSLKKKDQLPPLVHAACSAASLRYPKSRYNMVRIGIMQYGFFPSQENWVEYVKETGEHEFPLKRVISWKSTIMSIKDVARGEFVGYGNSYFTNTATKIAIVPVGYGLGFNRDLSNQGKVLIGGERVNVIGIVNMNAITVDISGMDDVQLGDEVVLIGKQGDAEISVSSFSDISKLINYELLTRLPREIPRVLVD